MNSLSTSQVAGLSLMAGAVLTFIASMFSPGGLIIDSVDQSNFAATLESFALSDSLTHVTGMLIMLSFVMMAFGLAALLRLPRENGLADFALRFGVGITLFAWGIYIIEIGMRHMAVHITKHGLGPDMDAMAREDLGLAVLLAMVGVHFGFIALGAVGSFLVGLAVAVRFHQFNIYMIAGYAFAAKGVAEVINLALIQHLHDVDFGVLTTVSDLLLFLGGVWLFIIGYGIFRGRRELAPESD